MNLRTLATLSIVAILSTPLMAAQIEVTITNHSPADGVYITPLWVGFHDGSFDSYNGGLSSQPGLERIAEDGDFSLISQDFLAGLTYIDGSNQSATVPSGQAPSERVDGAIANGGPIAPGESASSVFNLYLSGPNRYLSYVSMVLPSNDYYVANGNPLAHSLGALNGAPVGTSFSFDIGLPGTVNDAGTEVNDFATSAANGLFGLPGGQTGPNQGADENGVNANVITPFSDFQGIPADFLATQSELLFNNAALYPNGLANITVTVVPEPALNGIGGLLGMALLGLWRRIS